MQGRDFCCYSGFHQVKSAGKWRARLECEGVNEGCVSEDTSRSNAGTRDSSTAVVTERLWMSVPNRAPLGVCSVWVGAATSMVLRRTMSLYRNSDAGP